MQYSNQNWEILVGSTFSRVKKLSESKGHEYSGDYDRLANFRRNAANLNLSKEQVWAVYAAKHWDSIMQHIADRNAHEPRSYIPSEPIEGRVVDLVVYLILYLAMLEESNRPSEGMESRKTAGEVLQRKY